MRIESTQRLIRGLDPREANSQDLSTTKQTEKEMESVHGDRLDFLSAKTAANSLSESEKSSGKIGELSAERAAQIRNRIKSHFYDSPAVLNETVDNLLNFYAD